MSQVPYGPGPAAPPASWGGPPPSSRGPSRLPTIIAIVIAVIAVAVAVGAWFRPMPKPEAPAAKTYSDQEVADAKKAVCDAFDRTHKALEVTNGKNAGTDPTAILAVAANGRIALTVGADYLLAAIDANPALNPDFADAVKDLAGSYRRMAVDYLAEVPATDMNATFQMADGAAARVGQFCT